MKKNIMKALGIFLLLMLSGLVVYDTGSSSDKPGDMAQAQRIDNAKEMLKHSWDSVSDSAKSEYVRHWKEFLKANYVTHAKGDVPPKQGYVPDEKTAIRIAEAVWLPIYGNDIYDEKPFVAVLLKNNVWLVTGTLPPGWMGGTAMAEIRKSDGRVLCVYHEK